MTETDFGCILSSSLEQHGSQLSHLGLAGILLVIIDQIRLAGLMAHYPPNQRPIVDRLLRWARYVDQFDGLVGDAVRALAGQGRSLGVHASPDGGKGVPRQVENLSRVEGET